MQDFWAYKPNNKKAVTWNYEPKDDGSIAALIVFMQKEREHQKNSETSNSEHNEYIARKWMI